MRCAAVAGGSDGSFFNSAYAASASAAGWHVVVDIGQGFGGFRILAQSGVGSPERELNVGPRGQAVFLQQFGGFGSAAFGQQRAGVTQVRIAHQQRIRIRAC